VQVRRFSPPRHVADRSRRAAWTKAGAWRPVGAWPRTRASSGTQRTQGTQRAEGTQRTEGPTDDSALGDRPVCSTRQRRFCTGRSRPVRRPFSRSPSPRSGWLASSGWVTTHQRLVSHPEVVAHPADARREVEGTNGVLTAPISSTSPAAPAGRPRRDNTPADSTGERITSLLGPGARSRYASCSIRVRGPATRAARSGCEVPLGDLLGPGARSRYASCSIRVRGLATRAARPPSRRRRCRPAGQPRRPRGTCRRAAGCARACGRRRCRAPRWRAAPR
jgi:hypothetical protein